ncbi:Fur family transcriptional regulator [Paraburkholderia bannensis]|uniref:Fur family transcriptional regulator n=2 Tax=Paraburkholderia bannensis TaxID=765414 RepID=UPI002AB1A908|nr:Fur family transcriptional regulator [Paraburkholderia bannensis]
MRAIYADLKRARMRPTSSRVAVLQLFHEFPTEHMTADQVFRRVPPDTEQCSLASVYRALAQLLEAGLITNAWIGEQRVVYELNRGTRHSHLVCNDCGTIRDIDDSELEMQHATIAAAREFSYTSASLVIFGRCAQCEAALEAGGRSVKALAVARRAQ